ncbi:MAG: aminotransferase class V-fold PLP-dependent enzyme [Candidatus Obscuribacterales bacterium]|nr:aminotransferase class V-fold PLP-dependent enzyme [Candidatus Obscuribacterales bacterium]
MSSIKPISKFEGKKIYFDNAATSFPKPEPVLTAIDMYLRSCGNPGRGAHSYALAGARTIFDSREAIAAFLGIEPSERLIFTPGCTESINMVLKGLVLSGGLSGGDVVVTTSMEHNSVMRPLFQLQASPGIRVETVDFCVDPEVFADNLRIRLIETKARLCFLMRASNVTGELLPIKQAAAVCNDLSVPLAVDAAQSAGKVEVDLSQSGISYWCASGHKGLLGPPGIGLLYVAPGAPLSPIVTGGTGSSSESYEVPETMPDRFEAGTQGGQNIAGLAAACAWLKKRDAEAVLRHELNLTERFHVWAQSRRENQADIEVFGPQSCYSDDKPRILVKMPVVSFRLKGLSPALIAEKLDRDYGIAVRPGLHCAIAAHKRLVTDDTGLVRVSFGPFNSLIELERLISALEEIMLDGSKQ